MKAISDAVGRPTKRLISWKCRYCIQAGKEILRQAATAEAEPERVLTTVHVMERAHRLAITEASELCSVRAGRHKPQVWQNRDPIMNSVPQSAQASAISVFSEGKTAAGRAVSVSGPSTVGDRQNSCCVS